MPPKPKYSVEEIVRAAYGIVRDLGIDALSARELAARLGSSPSPIFTVFSSMEELKAKVWNLAMTELSEKVGRAAEKSDLPYKAVGREIIDFAATEPNLFALLFLRPDQEPSGSRKSVPDTKSLAERSVEMIVAGYGLEREQAWTFFEQMWIYVMGICTMLVNRLIVLTPEQIDQMLTFQFTALMAVIAPGKSAEPPAPDGSGESGPLSPQ